MPNPENLGPADVIASVESDDSNMDIVFQSISRIIGTEIANCLSEIHKTADCDVPEKKAIIFLRFHSFITDPQPRYIIRWREVPELERKWYRSHVNGILGDVRGALAAAHYHLERLGDIELNVSNIIKESNIFSLLGQSTMGIGSTRKLDIEYESFILACRRSLDYLAVALACYFKTDASSFRRLNKSIVNKKPEPVSLALIQSHNSHLGDLSFLLDEGRKAVRNKIAHYEFVSAGCVNINAQGFFIAGGGENMPGPFGAEQETLYMALNRKLDRLYDCIEDMIDSFIREATCQNDQ